jgi:hypothetical protein
LVAELVSSTDLPARVAERGHLSPDRPGREDGAVVGARESSRCFLTP